MPSAYLAPNLSAIEIDNYEREHKPDKTGSRKRGGKLSPENFDKNVPNSINGLVERDVNRGLYFNLVSV